MAVDEKGYHEKGGSKNSARGYHGVGKQCWEDLSQEKIQAWIERIPRHIQEIIKLEGRQRVC